MPTGQNTILTHVSLVRIVDTNPIPFTRSRIPFHRRVASQKDGALVYSLKSSEISTTAEGFDDVFVAACGCGPRAMVKFLIEQKTLKASTKITQAFGAVVRNGNDETEIGRAHV